MSEKGHGLARVRIDSQIRSREGLVSEICIVGQSESKLPVSKIIGWCRAMIEPLEEVTPGEQSLVKTSHNFGV
jgi:hypothetical protein